MQLPPLGFYDVVRWLWQLVHSMAWKAQVAGIGAHSIYIQAADWIKRDVPSAEMYCAFLRIAGT